MNMFIKDPEATAELIAGTLLSPPLSYSLSLSLTCALSPSPPNLPYYILLTPMSPSFPAADKENP